MPEGPYCNTPYRSHKSHLLGFAYPLEVADRSPALSRGQYRLQPRELLLGGSTFPY